MAFKSIKTKLSFFTRIRLLFCKSYFGIDYGENDEAVVCEAKKLDGKIYIMKIEKVINAKN